MKIFLKILLVVSMISLPQQSFPAERMKLRHLTSLYFDERGVGFKQPESVACNEKSLLVVADTGNNRLLRFNFQEGIWRAGPEIRVPQLSHPIQVQINSAGEMLALDGKKRRIIRLSPDGQFKGYLDPEGLPSPAAPVPRSFRVDKKDSLYILDIFSGRVLVLGPEGKFQKSIEFPQKYGFLSDLAVDPRGNILVIDCVKARVFSAAKDSPSFSPLSGELKEYSNFPTSVTTDQRGTIYIVDKNGGQILVLGPDGSFLGRQLSMGWNEGLLYYPSQMCINERGEAFIADRSNSRIQIFTMVK